MAMGSEAKDSGRKRLLTEFDKPAAKLGESTGGRSKMSLVAMREHAKNDVEMPESNPPLADRSGFFTRGWAFWQMNLFFWGLYGMIALGLRLALGQTLWRAVVFTLLFEGVCLVFSLVLRSFYRRANRIFGLVPALLLIVLSFAAAAAQVGLASAFTVWSGWQNPVADFFSTTTLRLLIMWATFMAWSLGYYWLWAETERSLESDRREEASREAQRMELQMLRARLDPHFLFNSLNAIAAEIPTHPTAATDMVNELSEYLRYSLDHRKDSLVPLSAEVRSMEAYLRIQHARFGDRLRFSIDLAPDAASCLIPCFLLQPLVENAVKYGLADSGGGVLEVRLAARRVEKALEIRVSNTGVLRPSGSERTGVGLETLRRRLEIHYPERHDFQLIETRGEVVAELELRGEPCSA
jgi:two-component system LytT family sensor kinase